MDNQIFLLIKQENFIEVWKNETCFIHILNSNEILKKEFLWTEKMRFSQKPGVQFKNPNSKVQKPLERRLSHFPCCRFAL